MYGNNKKKQEKSRFFSFFSFFSLFFSFRFRRETEGSLPETERGERKTEELLKLTAMGLNIPVGGVSVSN